LIGREIRKRKKGTDKTKKSRDAVEMKGQISDDEFADLSGFHSPAIHGDQEIFQTYDSTIEVDDGPLPYADDEGKFS
jgi:hypothetical protein